MCNFRYVDSGCEFEYKLKDVVVQEDDIKLSCNRQTYNFLADCIPHISPPGTKMLNSLFGFG